MRRAVPLVSSLALHGVAALWVFLYQGELQRFEAIRLQVTFVEAPPPAPAPPPPTTPAPRRRRTPPPPEVDAPVEQVRDTPIDAINGTNSDTNTDTIDTSATRRTAPDTPLHEPPTQTDTTPAPAGPTERTIDLLPGSALAHFLSSRGLPTTYDARSGLGGGITPGSSGTGADEDEGERIGAAVERLARGFRSVSRVVNGLVDPYFAKLGRTATGLFDEREEPDAFARLLDLATPHTRALPPFRRAEFLLVQRPDGWPESLELLVPSGDAAFDDFARDCLRSATLSLEAPPAHGFGLGDDRITTRWRFETRPEHVVTNRGVDVDYRTLDDPGPFATPHGPHRIARRVTLVAVVGGEERPVGSGTPE